MKGYIAPAISSLLCLPLLPEHPILAVSAMLLLTVTILAFWTGVIKVERR